VNKFFAAISVPPALYAICELRQHNNTASPGCQGKNDRKKQQKNG
jgi:hypothetical protein